MTLINLKKVKRQNIVIPDFNSCRAGVGILQHYSCPMSRIAIRDKITTYSAARIGTARVGKGRF